MPQKFEFSIVWLIREKLGFSQLVLRASTTDQILAIPRQSSCSSGSR